MQGLIVFDTTGNIVYENFCDDGLVRLVVSAAKELDVSLLAYNRDSLLCERRDAYVDLLPTYRVCCGSSFYYGCFIFCFVHLDVFN